MKEFIKFLISANYKGALTLLYKRPRYFFLLFKIRIIEKYFKIDTFFLSPRFLIIYFFEEINLQKKYKYPLEACGNYFIDFKKIKNTFPILYSGGVGENISFDIEFLNKTKGLARLFDPTPQSIEYMRSKEANNLKFYPYALYKESKKVKIYFDKFKQVKSNSISNFLDFDQADFYMCDAYNIPDLMKKFNDNKIDILKLDVEGVSIGIVENCFKNNIYPNQIIIAIEVPMNYLSFFKFYRKLKIFINNLSENYELVNLRDRSRGVEMEILCLKKN